MVLAARTSAYQPLDLGERYFPRARLDLPARLVTFNGTFPCTLIDLSRSGAKLAASECPKIGAMVVVEGLPIELFGTVCWAASGLLGVEFQAPLPSDRIVGMRLYAKDEAVRQKQAQLAYARSWVQGVF